MKYLIDKSLWFSTHAAIDIKMNKLRRLLEATYNNRNSAFATNVSLRPPSSHECSYVSKKKSF